LLYGDKVAVFRGRLCIVAVVVFAAFVQVIAARRQFGRR
jgi:hypothetical protein